MLRKYIFGIIILLNSLSAQEFITGTVKEINSDKTLSNVNIYSEDHSVGVTTNKDGKFQLPFESAQEKITLIFSHVGYEIKSVVLLKKDISAPVTIELTPVNIDMGEVSVLSSRSEKILRKNPQLIEVINKKRFDISPAVTISDLMRMESGISLVRDGIWGTAISVRGLSRDNIVTLVDGNRIETATAISAGLSLVDVNDIERIEVLKGSASSLYGSGAMGGVVNIISKQSNYADNFFIHGSVQSSYNSVNTGSFSSMNIFTGSSDWHLKLTGSFRSALDTETPMGTLPNSRFHDNNLSGLLVVRTTDNQELKLNYQRSHATDVGVPGGSSFPVTADVRFPSEKRDMFSIDYSFTNISDNLLKLNIKYFYQYILRDVESIPNVVKNIPASEGSPAKRVSVLSITPKADHVTNGVLLQSDWYFNNHYINAGIDFWRRTYRGTREKVQKIEVLNPQSEVIATTNIIFGEKALPDADYNSLGVFIQDNISLLPNLSTTIGGRIDEIFVSNEAITNPVYQITNGMRNDNPPNQVITFEESDATNFSWSTNISLLYNLTDDFDITLSFARSFRSPTLEERYQYIDLGSYVRIGDPDLEPENGYFTDLGIRYWGKQLLFKGNIFFNRLSNLVVEKPGIFNEREAFIKTNIGEASLYGFDCSLQYLLSENTRFYSTAAYVRGKDTGEEKDLPQIAPLNGNIGISFPVFNILLADINTTVYAEQDKIAEGEQSTPGYMVANCSMQIPGINFANISLDLFFGIENIFDKSYRNHLATNRNFINAEPGRNIYAKVKLNW